jgi:hypothetical protein
MSMWICCYNFGGGAGEGLAAMGGYQCGVKGAAVVDADALPRDRNNLGSIHPLPDATPFLVNR